MGKLPDSMNIGLWLVHLRGWERKMRNHGCAVLKAYAAAMRRGFSVFARYMYVKCLWNVTVLCHIMVPLRTVGS